MNIVQTLAVAVIGVILCLTVRQEHPTFAILIGTVTGIAVLLSALSGIGEAIGYASSFLEQANMQNEHFQSVLKAVGICYITQFTADLCADAGETSIASKVELAGRIAILVISLPMIGTLFELLTDVMEMG